MSEHDEKKRDEEIEDENLEDVSGGNVFVPGRVYTVKDDARPDGYIGETEKNLDRKGRT